MIRYQLRQGNRVIGNVSATRYAMILRELKRDGYARAYEILHTARATLLANMDMAALTEHETKALHVASGATDNTRLLLEGRYWHGAVLEAVRT